MGRMKDTHLTSMRTDDEVEHEHEAQKVVQHEVDHHQLIIRPESTWNRAALAEVLKTSAVHHEYIYIHTYIKRGREREREIDTYIHIYTYI
jgi:hypothetical protein